MSDILKDLYYDKFSRIDENLVYTKAYQEKVMQLAATEKEFLSCLNNEEKDLYEQLGQAQFELDQMDTMDIFKNGFRIGMQLMMAALRDDRT